MNKSTTPTSRRRWFRFRLRTLFALVTVVALFMGWVAKERNQSWHERQVAEQLEKQGVHFYFGGPYDSLELDSTQGWWRTLARQVLGARILAIGIQHPDFSDLTPLAGLKNVEALHLYSRSVRDLTPLAGPNNLQVPQLSSTPVSDLTPLAGLKNLKLLCLDHVPVSKKQIKSLQQALPNCKILQLDSF